MSSLRRLLCDAGAAGLATLALACSPSLNWREVRVGNAVQAWLPCKPETIERRLTLAGAAVPARMWVCDADGTTWSVTVFDVADATHSRTALREVRHLLAMNVGGREVASRPWQGGGFPPSDDARRMTWQGQRPGGQPVTAHAAFVSDGAQVVQAVALVPGSRTGVEGALDEFFGGLRRLAAASS